jgi:hypothetical protein
MQTAMSSLAECLGISVDDLPDGCDELLAVELKRWQRISLGVLPASEIMRIADKIKYIDPETLKETVEAGYRSEGKFIPGDLCTAYYKGTTFHNAEYVSAFGDKHKVKLDGHVRVVEIPPKSLEPIEI